HCCLTSLCVYRQINSYQPPSGYLSITRLASGGSERDLRRQQAQEVPKACKKAGFAPTGAVCRSCITMPVSTGASPTRRERRFAFPGSQVFGAGTLPVGFQGRSALVAKGEIPVQETCRRRHYCISYWNIKQEIGKMMYAEYQGILQTIRNKIRIGLWPPRLSRAITFPG
ncbi:hypothetical protein, partial [uncultured Victivallis sp.]